MSDERTFDVPMDPGDGAIYTLRFPSEELARRTIRQIESGVRHENAAQGCAAFKARVAVLLKELEFHVTVGGGGAPEFDPEWHLCPKCARDSVHSPDCALAAMIRECEA